MARTNDVRTKRQAANLLRNVANTLPCLVQFTARGMVYQGHKLHHVGDAWLVGVEPLRPAPGQVSRHYRKLFIVPRSAITPCST